MNTTKTIAALFDFDGVIMDTETQYTVFWDEQGRKYLNEEDFGRRIKGQTLSQIYEKHFADKPEAQLEISAELNVYEKKMSYEYIPGVEAFIADLRRNGAKIAVVTSSNEEKMANVYNAHPEFKGMVDRILTGEMFARHANGKQAYSYHPTLSTDGCPAEQNEKDASSNNIHPYSVPARYFCLR